MFRGWTAAWLRLGPNVRNFDTSMTLLADLLMAIPFTDCRCVHDSGAGASRIFLRLLSAVLTSGSLFNSAAAQFCRLVAFKERIEIFT